MSADLLRRAALKLREHANRAPEGPWASLDNGDRLVALRENRDHFPAGFRYLVDEPFADESIPEYFALMHPPVALALADALAQAAIVVENGEAATPPSTARLPRMLVAVARAVLREEEPS